MDNYFIYPLLCTPISFNMSKNRVTANNSNQNSADRVNSGKNLVIVESPAKAKTIEKYLGKEYTVISSYGHIRDLATKKGKGGLGIDVANGFKPFYEVPADKNKVVEKLKSEANKASMVWLASDEDREGEAIAWHLFDTLGLSEDKTKRIAFHEITKNAILQAIENPRSIDMDLVNAQQARRVLDRLVGFELSPVLWKKIRTGLSAGRVQSVALKLVVDRENEIKNFESSCYYKVFGIFNPEGNDAHLKANLDKKFETIEEVEQFLSLCQISNFTISKIETKGGTKSPAAPFTTSSLQQEAARKLNLSVKQTMSIAQKLYEEGLITYMRTDSTNLSGLAIATAKEKINELFGEEYSKVRQYKTKTKGAQEAHEAIRPTDLKVENIKGTPQEQRLYNLIWKRTIASQMADAKTEKTEIGISSDKFSELFDIHTERVLFDGFLKLYFESKDEDSAEEGELLNLPPLNIGQRMYRESITAQQKYTAAPPRYTEGSLVKRMEELEIGRPSTYSPTINTLFDRNYVIKRSKDGSVREIVEINLVGEEISHKTITEHYGKEKNKLFPEDIGIMVTNYLVENFDSIVNYDFTAKMEENLDIVAEGKMEWDKLIADFYAPFHQTIIDADKNSKLCKFERQIGVDPETGKVVIAKMGPYGAFVQIGENEDKGKRSASLKKDQTINDITLEEALKLFDLPRILGEFENLEIQANIGRFGPYLKHGSAFIAIKNLADPYSVTLDEAIEIIKNNRLKVTSSTIKEFPDNDITVLNGKFGPYIKHSGNNYKIPKGTDASTLELDDCLRIINDDSNLSKNSKRKKNSK